MHPLARLDRRYVWHPFTQMRDWLRREPIVIVRGRGAKLQDARGRTYLDGNSSIWTNLHGHNHPSLNRAIAAQLRSIAHSSALGLANEPASLLAKELIAAANPRLGISGSQARSRSALQPRLSKIFFSDNGSTALEVALKLAFQFSRRSGLSPNPRFLSLQGGYHGDTVGAVSLGHLDLFHKAYSPLLFKTDEVMAPYCYRCPFNRAKPQRADAREYRKCAWECVDQIERKFATSKRKGNCYSGFIFEPLLQGAAGMIPQPAGWLGRAAEIARGYGTLLIADEVMSGFGRLGDRWLLGSSNGAGLPRQSSKSKNVASGTGASSDDREVSLSVLFASHLEGVQPDFLALAKGLTGGYVPMAATLTTQKIFDSFLGEYDEFKTFFHGHSFTGNQVGAASALASLSLLRSRSCKAARRELENVMRDELALVWRHPQVGDVRQIGLVAGVELVKDWRSREPFELSERVGVRVCDAMARRGVLTRPVGNVIVLMPPYCMTPRQLQKMIHVLSESIQQELRNP